MRQNKNINIGAEWPWICVACGVFTTLATLGGMITGSTPETVIWFPIVSILLGVAAIILGFLALPTSIDSSGINIIFGMLSIAFGIIILFINIPCMLTLVTLL